MATALLSLLLAGVPGAAAAASGSEGTCGADGDCVRDQLTMAVGFNGDAENVTAVEIAGDLDTFLTSACKALGVEDAKNACAAGSGARLVDSAGSRVRSVDDILAGNHLPPLFVVPRWLHFVWPTVEVGHTVRPTNVKSADEDNPIELTTLSLRPRVFNIKNFMSLEETKALIDQNKPRMKRSTVGATAQFDRTRTSSNTWDIHSDLARRFKRRAFELLGMDHHPSLEDGLQVLNYQKGQYYKPHVDWLNPETEDVEGNLNPMVNNGTNRFATVFFYLNTVPKGGHTVFPRSYSHEGFDGNKVMRDGPANPPPGYISDRDAAWACNTSSSALRSEPVAGNAVLFYNQLPTGHLDHESLHGGCPPIEGEKWAVNLWVWNRPRDGSFRPKWKDKDKAKKPEGQISFNVKNDAESSADIHWISPDGSLHKMGTIGPGEFLGLNSYDTHEFGATDEGTKGPVWWKHVVKPADEAQVIFCSKGIVSSSH